MTTMLKISSKYAHEVISTNSTMFSGIEIQGVKVIGSSYEMDNEEPEFYISFAKLSEGGVDAIGEFSSYQDCLDYSKDVANTFGWKILNFCA